MRSARYAGEDASDEENLDSCCARSARRDDRRVAYVCALAYVDGEATSACSRGAARATLAPSRAATEASATTRRSSPTTRADDDRTMAELDRRREARDQPPRACRARARRAAREPVERIDAGAPRRGAACVSIASNSLLSPSSSSPARSPARSRSSPRPRTRRSTCVASIVALLLGTQGRRARRRRHPYGHEKLENLAAAIEGMLIVLGAAIIIYEAARTLSSARSRPPGLGIAVIAVLRARQPGRPVSSRRGASSTRRRSRATPRTWGPTRSLRSACSRPRARAGHRRRRSTRSRARRRGGDRLLRRAAPERLGARAGRRGPAAPRRWTRIESTIEARAGRRRSSASTSSGRAARDHAASGPPLQFRAAPRSSAHEAAHQLRDAIEADLPGADVLIHLEPEGSFRTRLRDERGRFDLGLNVRSRSEQVHCGRRADRGHHDRIADVAVQGKDQRGDGARTTITSQETRARDMPVCWRR